MKNIGIIDKHGYVELENGERFQLPIRGNDNGYPEVLIDARNVGGYGSFSRQSIQPFIGMKCEFFITKNGLDPYDFKIV